MSGPNDTARRGPERWVRARTNALLNPDSAAAKLYLKRVNNAHRLAADADNPLTAHEHVKTWFNRFTGENEQKREHCTCSTFCAGMQMQLDLSTVDLAEIACEISRPGRHRILPRTMDRSTLTRSVRCQVCGDEIERLTK